jgi:hypothetical protein
MVVGKAEGTTYSFKEDAYTYDREVWSNKRTIWTKEEHETFYEEGTYLVYVKAQWKYSEEATWTLSTYGPAAVDFHKPHIKGHHKWHFLEAVYLDKAKRQIGKSLIPFSGDTQYSCTRAGGFIIYAFFSKYEDKSLLWRIKLDNCESHMKINPPHAEGNG